MTVDTQSPFGRYTPAPSIRRAISLAQGAGNNPIGRQVAKLAEAWVKHNATPPLDLEVAGLKLRCYLWDNYTERKLVFMPWRFDVRERQYISSVLPPDGVFVDIGANVGVYSLIAAAQMNRSGRILGLEPYPPVFSRLLFNISATGQGRDNWPTIVVLPIGVADLESEFELHLNAGNLGENSIVAAGNPNSGDEAITIKCRPLLKILQEQAVDQIDVLKIDIEGAEDIALCPFLADAPDTLLPRHILIENSERRWQQDLTAAIQARGYMAALQSRMNTIYRLPGIGG